MKYLRLKEICKDIVDCPHSTPQWRKEGIAVIRNFNLKHGKIDLKEGYYVDEATYLDRTKRAIPEFEDIIFSREAPVGMAAIVPKDLKCCLGQRLVLLKVDKEKCNPHYLLYMLLSKFVQKQFQKADSTGSVVSNLRISDLREIEIPMLEHQENITNFLRAFDKQISNYEDINLLLEKQIQMTYEYWFLQFEFPDKTGKPYRSHNGKMLYDMRLNRKIPEDWKVKSLLELADWKCNSQPPKNRFLYEPKDGYVRLIQNRDYDSEDYKTYIPMNKNLNLAKPLDILLDKYGDAGKTRYGIEGAFNVALGKIEVHREEHLEYLRCFLENEGIYEYLHKSSMASTRASLNETHLRNLYLAVPAEDVVKKFQEFAHPMRRAILQNKSQINELLNMRAWYLELLMSGQASIG